jgi:hypothetical protein
MSSIVALLLLMPTVAGLGAADWEKPWFCHGLDCPVYNVKEQNDVYELRAYQAGMTARLRMRCG